jgi:hypothetical protein
LPATNRPRSLLNREGTPPTSSRPPSTTFGYSPRPARGVRFHAAPSADLWLPPAAPEVTDTEPCTAKRSARFGAVDDARAGLDLGTANLNSTECSSFNARARFDRGTRSNEAATRELL